jgi:hypothetical protein
MQSVFILDFTTPGENSNIELAVMSGFLSDVIVNLFCYTWRGTEIEFMLIGDGRERQRGSGAAGAQGSHATPSSVQVKNE